ncbi:MAG TPA: glucuronate isomerase [Bacteroidales bacterium]|nr:glucuronate isomerase [Bacteroidales bacterium]HPJ54803.1 glucuronate isomerase [Bacteroidales bacterium]HPQ55627.1 glucuronate isomerase [Bacteroidales bacterium]
MEQFNDENFLLQTKAARRLYHDYARELPIIDFHCHLDPTEIARDRQFENMTRVWLNGDHYKWRAMRANGIDERFITGTETTDWEKFEKWAQTVPYTMRNPLYHWTHMELKSAFGIKELLNSESAERIYLQCNERLAEKDFSARGLIKKFGVETLCTTDDPADSLEHHRKIAADGFAVKVLPAWRPDKAMAVEDPAAYKKYVEKLAEVSGVDIRSFDTLIEALRVRHAYFGEHGCRLSDHGIEEFFAEEYTPAGVETVFRKVMSGKEPGVQEIRMFKTAMLTEFGIMDWETGWTQQFHYGALRNNNTRMFRRIGPDTGYDSIGDFTVARNMSRFLDGLDSRDKLAKTIIYNLNPGDNEMVATMAGNFQDGRIPGKIQFGAAWWFLDQKDGMEKQLNTLSLLGLLSRFVGMLTDSRSFLSYARHDYFRRTLCNILGNDIEQGLLPVSETEFIGKQIVQAVCYRNALEYFKF